MLKSFQIVSTQAADGAKRTKTFNHIAVSLSAELSDITSSLKAIAQRMVRLTTNIYKESNYIITYNLDTEYEGGVQAVHHLDM